MKTGCTFHVNKIHIERSNDTWISILRKKLFLCNFIHNTGTKYYFTIDSLSPWRFPNPPANSFSPYQDCIYNTSVLILFFETNPKTVCNHNHALTIQRVELLPCFTNINKHYGTVAHGSMEWQCRVFFILVCENNPYVSCWRSVANSYYFRHDFLPPLTNLLLSDHVAQRLTRRPVLRCPIIFLALPSSGNMVIGGN